MNSLIKLLIPLITLFAILESSQVNGQQLLSWSKSSSLFDNLAFHKFGCQVRISKHIVFFCQDGYVAISPLSSFINSKSKMKADKVLNQVISEVNMLDYITLVQDESVYALEYFKDDYKIKNSTKFQFQLRDQYQILNSYYYQNFLLVQIHDSEMSAIKKSPNQFFQIYSAYDYKYPLATLQATIQSFQLFVDDTTINIYAVQDQPHQSTRLIIKQISDAKHATIDDFFDIENCGTFLKVTKKLIIIGCPTYSSNTGRLTIYQRQNFKMIRDIEGPSLGSNFSDSFQVSESDDGNQVYVVSTVINQRNKPQNQSFAIVEILLNDLLDEESQYVEVSYFKTADYKINNKNAGQLKFAAGNQQLLFMFEKFDTIFGITLCDYKSQLDSSLNSCSACPSKQYSLSHQGKCLPCQEQDNLSKDEIAKLDFLCNIEEHTAQGKNILGIIVGVVATIAVILIIITTLLILYKTNRICQRSRPTPFQGNPQDQQLQHQQQHLDQNEIQIQIEQIVRRRMRDGTLAQDAEKNRIMKGLEEIIPIKFYGQTEKKQKFLSCCICFEDFTSETIVRETPCLHIFHNHCLMDWLKLKANTAPNCPFCREEFKA